MDENQEKKDSKANGDNQKDDKYRLLASMSFMIVVILIGVPMWWKTTEVYRVDLPYTSISDLSEQPIKIALKIGIYTKEDARANLLINELKEAFKGDVLWLLIFEQISSNEETTKFKTPVAFENFIRKEYKYEVGDFIFIEWPKIQEEILMTSDRSALIREDTTSTKIKMVITSLIMQTHRIHQILMEDQKYATKKEAPQTDYDVIVSVLNPKPEVMNVKWNVQMAVETYLAPFLAEVGQISNYTLKTQWKFQLPMETDLKQIRDSSKFGRHYALPESSLPHIITAIEKNLGVGITAKTAINLVVYVPPCEVAPMHIYDRNNKLATRNNVNSFISPKWGGIIIANPPADLCLELMSGKKRLIEFYINTNDVMQIMLFQLQKLLDISTEIFIDGVKSVDLEQIAPRTWEYEAFIRRSTVMHIATATNTLQSLIKLLDNINYIVINDEVGAAINDAFENIQHAKFALKNHQLLVASNYAKAAFVASEQAFFDASLLAQLYFPDEQKYAIYIPLFLPIMVPVITSFSTIRKLFAKLKANQKTKTD